MSEATLADAFKTAKQQNSKIYTLLNIGKQHGFINPLYRKLIWPFLLGIDIDPFGNSGIFQWKKQMDHENQQYQIIKKDVKQSLPKMRMFTDINQFHLKQRQKEIISVLQAYFSKNTCFKYYQGFYSLANIILKISGKNTGYFLLEQISKVYFPDFLKYPMQQAFQPIQSITYSLIIKIDPEFQKLFSCFEKSRKLDFIIPWISTWFACDFQKIERIERIWDYILSFGPLGLIYLSCAIIIELKQILKRQCRQYNQLSINSFYSQKIKGQEVNIQESIQLAIKVSKKVSIQNLDEYKLFKQDSIFRINNLYEKLQIHKRYVQEQKQYQNKSLVYKKAIGFSIITLIVAVGVFYKTDLSEKIKNIFKK